MMALLWSTDQINIVSDSNDLTDLELLVAAAIALFMISLSFALQGDKYEQKARLFLQPSCDPSICSTYYREGVLA